MYCRDLCSLGFATLLTHSISLQPSTKDYDVISKRFASGGGDNLVKVWKFR